jgi:hypothetical protein
MSKGFIYSLVANLNTQTAVKTLYNLGISKVIMEYSGNSDSGSVSGITYRDSKLNDFPYELTYIEITLPYSRQFVEYINVYYYKHKDIAVGLIPSDIFNVLKQIEESNLKETDEANSYVSALLELDKENIPCTMALENLLEDLFYKEISIQAAGWQNDEGSAGQFIINIKKTDDNQLEVSTCLEHRQYFIDYEDSTFNNILDIPIH